MTEELEGKINKSLRDIHVSIQSVDKTVGILSATTKEQYKTTTDLLAHVRMKAQLNRDNLDHHLVDCEKMKSEIVNSCKGHTNKMFWGMFLAFSTLTGIVVSIVRLFL